MARNTERDAREAQRRKRQLVETGFRLFSERGIECVSLQTVATEADVGVATMYKYFRTKTNLLVAISAFIWSEVWNSAKEELGQGVLENYNAYQGIEFYCDQIIKLYQCKPEILRFSSDYKTFVCRNGFSDEIVMEQMDVLKPIGDLFHHYYEKAKTDHSIRTDIPEQEMFTTYTLTMLGMAERYAQGLVWAKLEERDYSRELTYLKEMLLGWAKA